MYSNRDFQNDKTSKRYTPLHEWMHTAVAPILSESVDLVKIPTIHSTSAAFEKSLSNFAPVAAATTKARARIDETWPGALL